MKKTNFLFAALILAALTFGFVGCENPDDEPGFSLENVGEDDDKNPDGSVTPPSTPEKPTLIATGDVTNLAEKSATFWGRLNADTLWALPNVKWGVEYAYDREAVSQHKHQETTKVNCTAGLQGANMDEFSVTIDGLQRSQTIYYSAYILINDMKYVYGELDSVHIVKLTVESSGSHYYYEITNCSGYYNYGSDVTITATPHEDMEFVQWSDGNTENPRTIILTSDVTYTATATFKVPDGVFLVSEYSGKCVVFSPGNLQYHPKNDEWRFAPSQLDYIGDGNENISSTYNGWLDLFGWSTNTTNFGVSTSTDAADYSGNFVDWGANQIGSDAPNTWRTLGRWEWNCLLTGRPNASSLCGVAQVNGVRGLILLPDSWTCPAGITFKSGFHDYYGAEYYAAYQTFTAAEWSKMEVAGAVFLPAAGYRAGDNVYYSYYQTKYPGHYWSSYDTGYNNSAYVYYLFFQSSEAAVTSMGRYAGNSVRLVKDL